MSVRVRVPASSANLGPGFDALGLALNIYNYVTVDEAGVSGTAHDTLQVIGEGAGTLVCDSDNIAFVAARRMLAWAGHENVPLHLTLENRIPLSRGLGSSAAARVGALVAVNEWLRRRHWRTATRGELVALANELEGHPDNVAAALLGGLVSSCALENSDKESEKSAVALRLNVERFPRLMVFVPDSELSTHASRNVLPDAVFRSDATFNVTRTALLLAALTTGRWDVLPEALRDCLHQPHRAQLMPGFLPMLHAAREAGAYGATLSGAGPSVLAWLPDGDDDLAAEVRQALETAAAQHEVFGHIRDVQVDLLGSVVEM